MTGQHTSSPASTGGAGIFFEQHVAAYWLAQLLLRGRPPILKETIVKEVYFQTEHLGWHTDDFLIVCERPGKASVHKLAGQVKRSFTVSAADDDCKSAIRDFWNDFKNADLFSPAEDRLLLVTLRGTNTLLKDFVGLLDCARAARNGEEFQHRLTTRGFISNKAVHYCDELRKIIADLEGGTVTAADLWPFLCLLYVLSLDLHTSTGQAEAYIKSLLTHTAIEGDASGTADASWNALLTLASTAMSEARGLRRDKLPPELQCRHRSLGTDEQRFLRGPEAFDWDLIEELLDKFPDVRSRSPAAVVERIETKLYEVLGLAKQLSVPDRGDGSPDKFHDDIDGAREDLKKHEYQRAKRRLQRIKDRSWDKLNARHKFRVFTHLASVEMSLDNFKGAAELCLEAKAYQPDDETARTNEALGYLILGQRERAFKLAGKLREEFPRSEHVLGIFIRSAPDSTALESLEEAVPQELFEKDEVAAALTERALDSGDIEKAERFVRTAIVAASHASNIWLLLGIAIFQLETLKSRERYGTEALFCDTARLREAENAFSEALRLAKEERSTSRTVEALLNRRQTRLALQKEDEAREDVEEARQLAPQEPRVIEAYGISFRIEGRTDKAIEVMRGVAPTALSPHGQMSLGTLLLERGEPGDYHSAGDVLSRVATSEEKLPEDFREYCLEMCLQAFAQEKQFDAGCELLEQVPEETVSAIGLKTLTARLHLLEGKQDKATKGADDARALLQDTATTFDVRRLALLLFDLRRFNDALPLWQRIAVPSVLSSDTKYLLDCAGQLNRHGIMLETFRELRQAGVTDQILLDNELSLLEAYDTDRAIKILDEEISRRPEDKALKLRRSMLGLRLDRDDLIDREPSNVPGADEVEPRAAVGVVHVLKATGHEQYAVQYAYEVLRHNFQEPDAHGAFLVALSPFGNEPQLEKPVCVETDTAVCYVEQGDSVPRWVVVEATPDPDSQLPEPELSPDDAICKAMMGKKVGDTFVLAESAIQDRIGEIKEIQNKYVYRYQDCMKQWQVRFPELPVVQAVKLPEKPGKSGERELDLSTILQSLDRRQEDVSNAERIYQEELVPLHIFGEHFGETAFSALDHLARRMDVPVKCCHGSVEEREQAKKALRSCNTLVLDMSAIASLFLLDRLDLLENWPIDLVVSTNTVNELRQMIANEERVNSKRSGRLLKTETGYAMIESTAEEKADYIGKLRHLVEVVEARCKVEPCEALAAMKPEKRETLVKLLGQYGAEAVLLAAVLGGVLWTDDLAQAGLARSEHDVSRVWTQFVIRARAESGLVDPETFLDMSAKLLGYGYHFPSPDPQIVRQAGVIAEWKMDSWPLSQALSVFAEESVGLEQILHLAAGFLALLYQESLLSTTKVNITVKILENIVKKNGRIQEIRDLREALPSIFGLNVVGLMDATANIDAWLKGVEGRPFGV